MFSPSFSFDFISRQKKKKNKYVMYINDDYFVNYIA